MSQIDGRNIREASSQISQVLIPVALSCLYTCIILYIIGLQQTITSSDPQKGSIPFIDRALEQAGIGSSGEMSFVVGLYVSIIVCSVIVGVSLLILTMVYLKCVSCLRLYFYVPTIFILSIATPIVYQQILMGLNKIAIDIITVSFITWNFTIFGMMAIFGIYAPTSLDVQQLYLVHNSTIVAVLLIYMLPGWAPWLLLIFLVIWDLFAVLSPFGPLNLILSITEADGIYDMPGLVYSTGAQQVRKTAIDQSDRNDTVQVDRASSAEIATEHETRLKAAHVVKTIDSDNSQKSDRSSKDSDARLSTCEKPSNVPTPQDRASSSSVDEMGINMGLGDFVYYNLMVGIAHQTSDGCSTLAAASSIMFGIIVTMGLLTKTREAIPAIPIAIFLALSTTLICKFTAVSLSRRLAYEAVFV